jgi:hypothetical protein
MNFSCLSRSLVSVVTLLAVATPVCLSAANVLSNPGLESDPAGHNQNLLGWQQYGPNNYNESGVDARSATNFY